MAVNAGTVYYTVDANTQKAIDSAAEMNKSLDTTKSKMSTLDTQVTKTSRAVNSGLSSVGRSAGQAGIQLQQFVGQIQGGQDAMLALSQQSADLGFVLGAPLVGAIVGIGASIAGLAINAMSTTGALEEFIEKLEELDSKGFASLEGQEQATAIAKLQTEISKANNERQKQIDKIEELRQKEKELEIQREETRSKGFAGAVETARINAVKEAIESAQISIQKYDREIDENQKNIGILNGELSANEEEIQSQVSALETAAGAFGKTGVALIEYNKNMTISKLETMGASQAEIEKAEAIFDGMIAMQRSTDAAKSKAASDRDAADAARERAKAERDARKASKGFIEGFGISGEKDIFEENPDMQATGISRAIAQENESLLTQLENQRGMIELYQDLGVGDAEAHAKALIAIDKKIANEKKKNNQAMLAASSDFFGASADLVGTFAGEQDNAYKALFAVSKAFAIANAAIQLQTAIANASALPWPANIPAIAQAVSFGTQIASSLASVSYAGGRLYGGSVQAGNMYRINENGAPEVFNAANGQQYMLPNTRGEVVSNYKLRKPDYPSVVTGGSQSNAQGSGQNQTNRAFKVEIVNQVENANYQTEMTEEGVKIIVAKYFNQNIDNGVSSVLGKKGTKTNKTLTSRYDTRNKL